MDQRSIFLIEHRIINKKLVNSPGMRHADGHHYCKEISMMEHTIGGVHFLTGKWPLDAGRNTVVFVHGSGNSRLLWKGQVKGLTEQVNAVAIDLPGHGKSVGPGMDTVDGYAAAVEKFIDEADIANPVPCGLSLGGAVVLRMLLDSPSRYRAGILINTGARLRVLPAIFDMVRSNYDGYTASLASVAASPKSDTALLKDIINDAKTCSSEVVLGDFTACDSFDVMDRLHEIKVPVLVLTAEEDRLSPVKYGRYLAEHIENSFYVEIPAAGHMSPLEKTEEVNRELRKFLDDAGLKIIDQ